MFEDSPEKNYFDVENQNNTSYIDSRSKLGDLSLLSASQNEFDNLTGSSKEAFSIVGDSESLFTGQSGSIGPLATGPALEVFEPTNLTRINDLTDMIIEEVTYFQHNIVRSLGFTGGYYNLNLQYRQIIAGNVIRQTQPKSTRFTIGGPMLINNSSTPGIYNRVSILPGSGGLGFRGFEPVGFTIDPFTFATQTIVDRV